jgi:DNA-binding Lrp family transcriptional regulator
VADAVARPPALTLRVGLETSSIPEYTNQAVTVSTTLKLDRIDLRILGHLQKNGRITNVELANAVCLSPSPCLVRVKRLEQAGYISSYSAHVDLAKLGDVLVVFAEITLSNHHVDDFNRFVRSIQKVDEAVECHMVSGDYDYLVKFIVRGVNHYQSLMETLLTKNLGIEKYYTYIVIKTGFVKNNVPIEFLFDQKI